MKDIIGVFFYEKQKGGREFVGRVTGVNKKGECNIQEEKRNMISLKELKHHLRVHAKSEKNMAKANKTVESEIRDMTVNLSDKGFVTSVRIFDEKDPKTNQMRAYFDPDEFELGPEFTKQLNNILKYVHEDNRELITQLICTMVDQTADGCAQAFSTVMGYANERIDEELKKGA